MKMMMIQRKKRGGKFLITVPLLGKKQEITQTQWNVLN